MLTNKSISKVYLNKLLIVLFILCFNVSKGQVKSFGNIKFQLTTSTETLFQNNLKALENGFALDTEDLIQFMASLPLIEPILLEHNVPSDFKFLSIYRKYHHTLIRAEEVEPGTHWNISIPMAQSLNLTINEDIDERKHIIKASEVFIPEINKLNLEYNHWGVTLFHLLASEEILYQTQASKKWNSNTITLDKPEYKPLIEFLAFKTYIENEYAKISNIETHVIYAFKSAVGKNLNYLSTLLGVDIYDLIKTNAWLNAGNVPKHLPVILYAPLSKYIEYKKIDESNFASNWDKEQLFPTLKLNESLQKGKGGIFYTINGLPGIQAEMGDKFINLAFKGDIHYIRFLEYNDMKPMDNIHIGKVYYLKEKKEKAAIAFHVTLPHETLWEISQMYGVKLQKLMEYNRMESITKLMPGQVIWMQSKRPKKEPVQFINNELANASSYMSSEPSQPIVAVVSNEIQIVPSKTNIAPKQDKEAVTKVSIKSENEEIVKKSESPKKFTIHEVKENESLEKISKIYNVEVQQLLDLNNLSHSEGIQTGLKLIIKKNI